MNDRPGTRVVVTGATGFVGGNLVKAMAARGYAIHALVRRNNSRATAVRELERYAEIQELEADNRSLPDVFRRIQPALVVHLAAEFVARHEYRDIGALLDANVKFATQVVDAAVSSGVRYFINTSTLWEHYNGAPEYDPVCLYAATKYAYQKILDYYINARGLTVITLLLSDTYGPDDPRNRFIDYVIDVIRKGGPLELSPGEQLLDLVHIDDVVRAYLLCVERLLGNEVRHSGRYAVSSGKPVTIRAIIGLLEKISGRQFDVDWNARPYRDREIMRPWPHIDAVPGWRAETGLEAGLKKKLAAQAPG